MSSPAPRRFASLSRVLAIVLCVFASFAAEAATDFETLIDGAFRTCWARCWSPRTSLLYGRKVAEVKKAATFTNGLYDWYKGTKEGYGAGMADCAISDGVALSGCVDRWAALAQEGVPADDPRMSETADWAAKLAQGLLNLASKHGYVGFVARGLCEEDGKSICSLSSIDQHTHWVHGLYRYAHSPMARPAILAEWRQRIAEVAARMERTVTSETEYNFGLCDGRPDPRGICRMWWPNETNSTGSCRLPSIYAAAYDATGDSRWKARYEELADKACADAACVTRNKREVRGWTGRTPTYVLLQMNASLEVMLGCEKDPVRRANLLEGLRQSAAEADYRAKTMWKDPKRKWYGMVPDAELALAQLMADNAPYDATELQIFTQAMTAGDPNDWWSLKTTHMFAAYWRARRRGLVPPGFTGAYPSPLAVEGTSRILFPSAAFELVTTGAADAYPGRHVNVRKGPVNLSACRELSILLSNRQDCVRTVRLSVKSAARQGRSPGGHVTLQPHGTGRIVCDLQPEPWCLDAPLAFVGMNGYPRAEEATGSNMFDIREVTSFHLYLPKGEPPDSFDVLDVRVGGAPRARTVYSAKTFLPFVDRYGQFAQGDWPGKVHDDADLAAARASEAAWLDAHAAGPSPDIDRWGGWTKGPRLKATGFFRTEKVNGRWWLVDPDGRLFWSNGIDCIDPGRPGHTATPVGFRESYFAWLPAQDDPVFGGFWGRQSWKAAHGFYAATNHLPFMTYSFVAANMVRKYGKDWRRQASELAHRRLRAWGLNTVANWSAAEVYSLGRTPYTLCLSTQGTPRRKGSKGWWGPLPDPENPAFASTLRTRARAAAKTMRNDPWCLGIFVDNELSWNSLPDLAHVADVYFATVAKVLREELPNHLYLGSRIAWGEPDVYRAAARHCDVVSVNVYEWRFERDLPEGSVDKPMINGEFHFGALDRGSFHSGLVVTRDQAERAANYRAYVESCLDHPRVVGTHWFQWRDQPLTGRPDGENYQIGFLTVTDAPYPELVEAARAVARTMYARRFEGQ